MFSVIFERSCNQMYVLPYEFVYLVGHIYEFKVVILYRQPIKFISYYCVLSNTQLKYGYLKLLNKEALP